MPQPDLLAPGQLAPDFELSDVHGQPVRLSAFRGAKVVVLAFLRGFK
jgi:peroxiredoxin